jgi:hypothetical protein
MAEPNFSNVTGMPTDDDLPRTLRREREAQARRARETATAAHAPADMLEGHDDSPPATVTRLEIPFFHLMAFFLKAVIAAIPALILLMALLWLAGEILTATFPELVKMQILIRMPN